MSASSKLNSALSELIASPTRPFRHSLSQGTLFGLANAIGIVDKDGKFPRMRAAFCSDSLSIVFGSLFGLAPLTAFIESGAGVEAGART